MAAQAASASTSIVDLYRKKLDSRSFRDAAPMLRLRRATLVAMSGRRRHPRFLLPNPVEALLRLREEVTVERWDASEIEVLAPAPCRRGEHLVLEVAGGNGQRPVGVTVRDSRVSAGAGDALRYRVLLAVDGDGVLAADGDGATRGEGSNW